MSLFPCRQAGKLLVGQTNRQETKSPFRFDEQRMEGYILRTCHDICQSGHKVTGMTWRPSLPYRCLSAYSHCDRRHRGNRKKNGVKGGDVILMHDDNPVCIEELPFLIVAARNIGLEFVCLSRISSFYLKENNVPFSTSLTVKSSKDDEPPL